MLSSLTIYISFPQLCVALILLFSLTNIHTLNVFNSLSLICGTDVSSVASKYTSPPVFYFQLFYSVIVISVDMDLSYQDCTWTYDESYIHCMGKELKEHASY